MPRQVCLLRRFLRTAMNQEPCSESITSPHDSCGKEQQDTLAATPSSTDVPTCAFPVRKAIPQKLITDAIFGNFPAGAMRMVSTESKANSTQDDNSLVLGLCSNTKEPPKIEKEAILEAVPRSPSSVYPGKDLEVMETDAATVACQSVASTGPTSGMVREECVSKQVGSEEEGGGSEEEGGASDEEGGASGEGGGVSEERGTTLLPMDTGIENAMLKIEPKDDELIAEHQLLEEHNTNFLFTMDVEGTLIENQHKQKSRRCKKSQGISDRGNPVLAPGGGNVKFRHRKQTSQHHSRLLSLRQKTESSISDRKPDNKSDSTKRSKKPPPNAFVSVRIPSAEIRDKLQEIHEAMVAHDKKLQSTLVSLNKLHITLFVIRLESEVEVERAKVALLESTRQVTAEMKLLSSPIVLEFGGVGSFSRRVVFASIKEGLAKERLTSAADMVRSIFEAHGICSTDGRAFNPHLTIAKISKSSGRERIYGIEKEVYSEFTDTELGSEVVTGLELLSMVEPAAVDGYYHCLQRYTFEEIQSEV